LPRKLAVGPRVHLDRRPLADSHPPELRLGDIDANPDLAGLEDPRDRLVGADEVAGAELHRFDDSRRRRLDGRLGPLPLEVPGLLLLGLERRLRGGDVLGTVAPLELQQRLARGPRLRRRGVVALLGHDALPEKPLLAQALRLGVLGESAGAGDLFRPRATEGLGEVGLRLGDLRLLLRDREVDQVRVELEDRRAGGPRRPFLDEDFRDPSAQKRSHLDVAGLDRAGEDERLVLALCPQPPAERAGGGQDGDDEQDHPLALHSCPRLEARIAPGFQICRSVSRYRSRGTGGSRCSTLWRKTYAWSEPRNASAAARGLRTSTAPASRARRKYPSRARIARAGGEVFFLGSNGRRMVR